MEFEYVNQFCCFQYSTPVQKYDRHGYKPRERVLILTNAALYLVDANKTVKQKHRLPLNQISLVATTEKDKILVIRLSDDLIDKDKVNTIRRKFGVLTLIRFRAI